MSIYHLDANQTAMIIGPAKIDLVAEFDPVYGEAEAPTVGSLAPDTAVAGDPTDIEMVVTGTGFNELSKIVFNGNDEPTTLLSDTQVRTIVKPSMFAVAADVPVSVRTGALRSSDLTFSFTEAAAQTARREGTHAHKQRR
jgi:hypothetical protein